MVVLGIDISLFQDPPEPVIDTCGPAFVGLKVTEGATYPDSGPGFDWLRRSTAKCRALDLPTIFYHFARPDRNAPQVEVDHFLDALKREVGALRPHEAIALDYETPPTDAAWAQAWLDDVKVRTGITPLFYSYPSFMDLMAWVPDYPLWLAQYSAPASRPYSIWQFGVVEDVDRNRHEGDIRAFLASLHPAAGLEWGAVTTNDVDFAIAREVLHLPHGWPIIGARDAASLSKVRAAVYVGAARAPASPWNLHERTVQLTGRGAEETREMLADWTAATPAPAPAYEWGVVVNNDTDFSIAHDTFHLGRGWPVIGAQDTPNIAKLHNAVYLGTARAPQVPWFLHQRTVQLTGRGADTTRHMAEEFLAKR